jgi:putative DNA primase/helicase
MARNGVSCNCAPSLKSGARLQADDPTDPGGANSTTNGVGAPHGLSDRLSDDGAVGVAATSGEATEMPPRPPRPPLFPDRIPPVLMSHRRWLVWRYEWQPRRRKWTKPPYNPVTGRAAASTDPECWGTYEDALATYERGDWDGIGFALGPGKAGPEGAGCGEGDGAADIVALDLDECTDPQTGQLEAWAAEVVEVMDTYAERSPSGLGIRLIARGQKPGLKCRKGNFEMYNRDRFVTITGCRLDGLPLTIESRQAAIDSIYGKLLGSPDPQPRPRAGKKVSDAPAGEMSLTAEDRSLLKKAQAAANGPKFTRLWDGDWEEGYDSQSEADLALCSILAFWAGSDADRIDRLFRQSSLFRDKWDEARGDQTYGEKTVALAMEGKDPPPAAGGTPERDRDREHLTDVGNARRFVRRNGEGVRYCHPWGKWLVWDGCRWRTDDTGGVERLAKETLHELHSKASAARTAVTKVCGGLTR